MRIIRAGLRPEDRKHVTECPHCDAKFEFVETEARVLMPTLIDVKCPCCSGEVHVHRAKRSMDYAWGTSGVGFVLRNPPPLLTDVGHGT